jgi:osmotically-inducible protein OsmY
MKSNLLIKLPVIGCATLLFALGAFAQEHQWAGRTLDAFEWRIHERLAALPHSAFNTVNFEVQGKAVTLSGQVIKESLKRNAERAVRRVNGVDHVINQIEVLPSSRQDDALRMNLYRAIYDKAPLEKYRGRSAPPIHIVVKNGWVTLEGIVDSDADRSMVQLRALNITAHVSDHLRVGLQEN